MIEFVPLSRITDDDHQHRRHRWGTCYPSPIETPNEVNSADQVSEGVLAAYHSLDSPYQIFIIRLRLHKGIYFLNHTLLARDYFCKIYSKIVHRNMDSMNQDGNDRDNKIYPPRRKADAKRAFPRRRYIIITGIECSITWNSDDNNVVQSSLNWLKWPYLAFILLVDLTLLIMSKIWPMIILTFPIVVVLIAAL